MKCRNDFFSYKLRVYEKKNSLLFFEQISERSIKIERENFNRERTKID